MQPMNEVTGSVLVVHGTPQVGQALRTLLVDEGFGARWVGTGEQALSSLEERPFDIVVTDLDLPDTSGTALLTTVLERWQGTPVIFVTAEASVPQAVEALKAGAADFLLEPCDREQLLFVVRKALAAAFARVEQTEAAPGGSILGDSPLMHDVQEQLRRAASGTATVLVRGESGTGKELVARAIHQQSPRRAAPFVKIDCASLPENLLESELFGYEKGAFTGATARKPGRVELADGGTVFLDEIGELSAPLQAKLLRLLQDREFERLGGTKTIRVDVRIVAATHRDLETMVDRGQFRQDLFYRLNVVPIWLPPLRARREDIEGLAMHFCKSFGRANGKPSVELDERALKALRGQRWPGNVRQLQNLVERLVVMSEGNKIREEDVRAELGRQVRFSTQPGTGGASLTAARGRLPTENSHQPSMVGPLDAEMRAAEKKAIERALRHAGGNRTLAARLLGVSRSTLYLKLEEHGML
jgi:two-component system response regulator AtoC